MSDSFYKLIDGKLVYFANPKDVGNDPIHEFAIGFCYAPELREHVLLKHGANEHVQKWMSKIGAKFRESGQIKDFKHYRVMHAPAEKWDLEEINKFLSIPGYFDRWMNDRNAEALKEIAGK